MLLFKKYASLLILCLILSGCAPSEPALPNPEPTPTPLTITVDGQVIELVPGVNILPEIYEAAKSPELLENVDWVFVDGYWDIMPKGVTIPLEVVEPALDAVPAPLYPGFPESWSAVAQPSSGLTFDYPADWQLEITETAVYLFPADRTFWFVIESHPNPVNASLAVWLAEYGPTQPGDILSESEETSAGNPALRQQVVFPESNGQLTGETIILWVAVGDHIVQWTAQPGDQAETHDLLTYMAATLHQ